MSLKKELNAVSKLIDNWQIKEADKILNDLYSKYPADNDIKVLLAVTQKSLYNRAGALQLLDTILNSNPEHEHAIAMYPSLVFELATDFIEKNDLAILKEKLERIEKMGFNKVGYDLGTAYKYLSLIYEKNSDFRKAVDYLELQKELYKTDDFLNDCHVKSGDIDNKIQS